MNQPLPIDTTPVYQATIDQLILEVIRRSPAIVIARTSVSEDGSKFHTNMHGDRMACSGLARVLVKVTDFDIAVATDQARK